jgi:hypothetical protein
MFMFIIHVLNINKVYIKDIVFQASCNDEGGQLAQISDYGENMYVRLYARIFYSKNVLCYFSIIL